MKKKLINIISIVCILIIGGIITAILIINNQNQQNNSNNNEQIKNVDNNGENMQEDDKVNDEKKEEQNINDIDDSKSINTKKEESKKKTNTNNTQSNQSSKTQEITSVVTETKYYSQCSGVSLDAGKQLTESEIKAKYPLVTTLKDSSKIKDDLSNDLEIFTPQVNIPNSLSNIAMVCQWTSTDNKNILGYTVVVELDIHKNFDGAGYYLGDDGQEHPVTELGKSMDRYNKYLEIWNSLKYKNDREKARTIAEYYYINGSNQWKWNPNNLHF